MIEVKKISEDGGPACTLQCIPVCVGVCVYKRQTTLCESVTIFHIVSVLFKFARINPPQKTSPDGAPVPICLGSLYIPYSNRPAPPSAIEPM